MGPTTGAYTQPSTNTPSRPLPEQTKKNYSYALKFSILDLSPKVTFLFLNLSKRKKEVQLFLIQACAKETHFVLVKKVRFFLNM